MSAWLDMARDGGFSGDEARQVADMLERDAYETAMRAEDERLAAELERDYAPFQRLEALEMLMVPEWAL